MEAEKSFRCDGQFHQVVENWAACGLVLKLKVVDLQQILFETFKKNLHFFFFFL